MAVPSSGPLSLLGIQREIFNNNYSASNSHSDISLTDLSEGADEDINTANAASDRPDGNTPHSMSEFYNYDHDFVAEIHSTTFQPEAREWIVPYQPIRKGSGFTTSLASGRNEPGTIGSVTTQGTFTIGGKSGVNLAALYNYDSTASPSGTSTTGETIVLQFHHASGTNFTNSGWSTAKIYNGSSASGTLVVTLTRTSATSYNSTITNSTNVRATYTFDGSRAFSTFFGNSTTASSNDQHFLLIE